MKKLTFNDKFEASLLDEGDEFYLNGIFEFNITNLLAFIKNNPDLFPIEHVQAEAIRYFDSKNLDESTLQTADLNVPIILGEISPNRFNVIDGNHRLEKAYRTGRKANENFEDDWSWTNTLKNFEEWV